MTFFKDPKKVLITLILVLLVLNVFAYILAVNYIRDLASSRLELATQDLRANITARLEMYEDALYGTKGLFTSTDEVTQEEWQNYMKETKLFDRHPGLEIIAYAPVVRPENLGNYENTFKTKVYPDQPTELYVPITYLEAISNEFESTVGYNVYSEAERKTAIDHAINNNSLAITNQIIPYSQRGRPNPEKVVALFIPIYSKGSDLSTVEQRRANVSGVLTTRMKMSDLMNNLNLAVAPGLKFQVFDSSSSGELTESSLLYNSGEDYILKPGFFSNFSKVDQINFSNKTWQIKYTALPDYGLDRLTVVGPYLILLFIILLSGALVLLVRFLLGLYHKSMKLAVATDQDLLLEDAVVDDLGEGIIITDEFGIVKVFNRTAEQILGYKESNIKGHLPFTDLLDEAELLSKTKELAIKTGIDSEPDFGVVVTNSLIEGRERCQWQLVTSTGKKIPTELMIKPIHKSMDLVGYEFVIIK